jgi:hypothetical protein
MKTKLLLALALLASSLASFADGLIIIRNPPPRSRPSPHPIFAPLEVVFHKVDVAIEGQKATTRRGAGVRKSKRRDARGATIYFQFRRARTSTSSRCESGTRDLEAGAARCQQGAGDL